MSKTILKRCFSSVIAIPCRLSSPQVWLCLRLLPLSPQLLSLHLRLLPLDLVMILVMMKQLLLILMILLTTRFTDFIRYYSLYYFYIWKNVFNLDVPPLRLLNPLNLLPLLHLSSPPLMTPNTLLITPLVPITQSLPLPMNPFTWPRIINFDDAPRF